MLVAVIVVVVLVALVVAWLIARRRTPDGVDSFRRQIDALSPEARRPTIDKIKPRDNGDDSPDAPDTPDAPDDER
ncbi:MAG: hypothetical protein AAGA42_07380 [Actinomycetota bacterium]